MYSKINRYCLKDSPAKSEKSGVGIYYNFLKQGKCYKCQKKKIKAIDRIVASMI